MGYLSDLKRSTRIYFPYGKKNIPLASEIVDQNVKQQQAGNIADAPPSSITSLPAPEMEWSIDTFIVSQPLDKKKKKPDNRKNVLNFIYRKAIGDFDIDLHAEYRQRMLWLFGTVS